MSIRGRRGLLKQVLEVLLNVLILEDSVCCSFLSITTVFMFAFHGQTIDVICYFFFNGCAVDRKTRFSICKSSWSFPLPFNFLISDCHLDSQKSIGLWTRTLSHLIKSQPHINEVWLTCELSLPSSRFARSHQWGYPLACSIPKWHKRVLRLNGYPLSTRFSVLDFVLRSSWF